MQLLLIDVYSVFIGFVNIHAPHPETDVILELGLFHGFR